MRKVEVRQSWDSEAYVIGLCVDRLLRWRGGARSDGKGWS